MAGHSRKFCLERLETRQLLSHLAAPAPDGASILAKPKPKTTSVVGTIAGSYSASQANTYASTVSNYDGEGSLPVLGLVQMKTTVPVTGGTTRHGTMTLTSAGGTLTLSVVVKRTGPFKLAVQHGTGQYAGWSGSGTVKVKLTQSGYSHSFTDENTFKLKLKT